MASSVVPVLGRLLVAGGPMAFNTLRAGLLVVNSSYYTAISENQQLTSLFSRNEADTFGKLAPEVATSRTRTVDAQRTLPKRLSKQDLALKEQAEKTLDSAMEIMESEDWRKVDSEGADELFVKKNEGRNIWKFRTIVKCSPEKFAKELIHNCENCPSWNKNIEQCQVHKIADGVDILRQETGPLAGGLVARREFVNVRRWGRRGQLHFSAVAAVEHHAFPQRSGVVRAQNHPTVFTVRPCADSPGACIVEGTLNYDLKLRLVPSQLIDGATASVWRQLRAQMHELAARVRR